MLRHRWAAPALAGCQMLTMVGASPARADDNTAPVTAPTSAALPRALEHVAAENATRRTIVRVVEGVAGAGLVSGGAYLAFSGESGDKGRTVIGSTAIGLGAVNIFQAASGSLRRDPHALLLAQYNSRAAAGVQAEENERLTLAAWEDEARSAATARKIWGVVGLSTGMVSLGLGLGLIAALPGPRHRDTVQAVGSSMIGLGSLCLTLGAEELLFPTSVEQTWSLWRERDASPRPALEKSALRVNAWGLAPTVGGAAASLGGTF